MISMFQFLKCLMVALLFSARTVLACTKCYFKMGRAQLSSHVRNHTVLET